MTSGNDLAMAALAGALTLLLARPAAAQTPYLVTATAETDPVHTSGDAADDAAI